MAKKVSPKAGLTLLSKHDDGWKFMHSPSGTADFDLKHHLLDKDVTLGMGFTHNTLRNVHKGIPGLMVSADLKLTPDTTLNLVHNISTKALKTGFTHNTVLAGKKSVVKAAFVNKGRVFTGEVTSQVAPNKKTTVNFTDKQVTNIKLALQDAQYTYEPSYNLLKKAPLLAVSRPVPHGKAKINWNLKTDDVTAEYTHNSGLKLAAMKRPGVAVPTVGLSIERTFTA